MFPGMFPGMARQLFVRRTHLAFPPEAVFRWHARPGAFERLTPPWAAETVLQRTGGIEDGGRVVLSVPIGPFRHRWIAEHRDYQDGRSFRDFQIDGPFSYWDHVHLIEPDGAGGCFLEDRIEYVLPWGPLGRWLLDSLIHSRLDRTFAYRHRIMTQDLTAHAQTTRTAMRVIVSGSSGLVGSALVPFLTTGGHQVERLVRSRPKPDEPSILWDPNAGQLDAASLEDRDAVVHLAGENIASGRWTADKKARIRDSRVKGTRLLCETLAKLARPPRVLVNASAVGFYGSRGDEVLTEDSSPGTGFLADVCKEWEQATAAAQQKGIRVVLLRFGVVFSPSGGALKPMLLPFRMGVGGRIGDGRQFISWIALDDVIGVIHHGLTAESLQGPVNAVSPNPVTNLELTKTLGRVLSRPTIVPMPAFAARLAFGEMADELLLSSQRAQPARLQQGGYSFRFPDLDGALRHMLGKQL